MLDTFIGQLHISMRQTSRQRGKPLDNRHARPSSKSAPDFDDVDLLAASLFKQAESLNAYLSREAGECRSAQAVLDSFSAQIAPDGISRSIQSSGYRPQ